MLCFQAWPSCSLSLCHLEVSVQRTEYQACLSLVPECGAEPSPTPTPPAFD